MPVKLDTDLFTLVGQELGEHGHTVHLGDPDTRRTIVVTLPGPQGLDPPEDDPDFTRQANKAADALAIQRDNVPSDTVAIKVDEAGKLLSFSTAREDDVTDSTDYVALEAYRLPVHFAKKTLLRSELTETGRIAKNVDLVSYPPSTPPSPSSDGNNRLVFKYSTDRALDVWTEVQILARVPRHPSLVLADRLVLDEMTGSKVVGFTMRYVAGETLDKANRLLKLSWLKQLLQVVDDLNLKYGIMHNDIADRNLMIDYDTDSILLIDFNIATPMTEKRTEYRLYQTGPRRREDVRSVLLFVYSFITRDASAFHQCLGARPRDRVEAKYFLEPAKWVKHPDVELDHDVADFYFELAAWIRRRRRAGEQTTHHHAEGPEQIRWPPFPGIPEQMVFPLHAVWRETGSPYLDWSRPPKAKLDPTRRLLATGRYADEEAAAQKAMAARKAGPKKPMVHPGQWASEAFFKLAGLGHPSAPAFRSGHGPPADERAGKPNASPGVAAAARNGNTGKAAGTADGVRRKLPPRRARLPAKRKQVGSGAGTRAGKRA